MAQKIAAKNNIGPEGIQAWQTRATVAREGRKASIILKTGAIRETYVDEMALKKTIDHQ